MLATMVLLAQVQAAQILLLGHMPLPQDLQEVQVLAELAIVLLAKSVMMMTRLLRAN